MMIRATPHAVLLAGGCGLELLSNLHLRAEVLQRISVFAYGPVTRCAPACAHLLTVIGDADWISCLGHGSATVRVPAGHLDYLQCTELLTLVQRFVAEVEVALP